MSLKELDESIIERAAQLAEQSFEEAIRTIDSKFGKHYALKNPPLVASIIEFQEKMCILLLKEKEDITVL